MKHSIPFAPTYAAPVSHEELLELYELKKEALSKEEQEHAERILNNKEKASYGKLQKTLSEK